MAIRDDVLTKGIEERHTSARHLYDTRAQWIRTLVLANIAAAAWVAANDFNPPMHAAVHLALLMDFLNLVGLAATIVAMRTFRELERQNQTALKMLLGSEQDFNDISMAMAIPTRSYEIALWFMFCVITIAAVSWIFVLAEARLNH